MHYGSWYEKTETTLPTALRNYYRCIIFGENFKDHGLIEDFGYNNKDHTIRLLKPTEFLRFYNPKRDPENFNVLFEKESTDLEKELLKEDRENTIRSFINRVTFISRLEIFPVFTQPDPYLHAVLIIPKNSFLVTTSKHGDNNTFPQLWSDPAILCMKDQRYFGQKRPSLLKYLEDTDGL